MNTIEKGALDAVNRVCRSRQRRIRRRLVLDAWKCLKCKRVFSTESPGRPCPDCQGEARRYRIYM